MKKVSKENILEDYFGNDSKKFGWIESSRRSGGECGE